MYRAIQENSDKIEDEGVRSYKLTRFFFVFVFRLIFEYDPIGKELLKNPASFRQTYKGRYYDAFVKLFRQLVEDFNYHVKGEKQNGYFDYKNVLRNAAKATALADEIVYAYKRALVRHSEDAFEKLITT